MDNADVMGYWHHGITVTLLLVTRLAVCNLIVTSGNVCFEIILILSSLLAFSIAIYWLSIVNPIYDESA